jgi:hypothetical protein
MTHWTPDIEKVLENIRLNSVLFAKEHKKRYLSLKKSLKYYRIPLIIISAINSVVSVGAQPFFIQQTISITNCVLSLICGIIGSIEIFIGIQNQMENELNSSKEYYLLSTNIFKTLSLFPNNRHTDGKTFLDECYSNYVKLYDNSGLNNKKMRDSLAPLPNELKDLIRQKTITDDVCSAKVIEKDIEQNNKNIDLINFIKETSYDSNDTKATQSLKDF